MLPENKTKAFFLSCHDKIFHLKKLLLVFHFSFFIFLLSLTKNSFARDSCNLRISLLTCAPGEELYATFGHTALRVQDFAEQTDLVFNYGTFEFSPGFYWKFIKGKLLYSLSVENFNDFMQEYQWEERSVQEQVLQLSCAEKQKLYTALKTNAEEQNRYYLYNFLLDNCTTRAGEMVTNNTNAVTFKNILPKQTPTFRELIHSYLNAGNKYWSKLGIDILLGAKTDKKVSGKEATFLPDYLLKAFDSTSINNHPLVAQKQTILQMPPAAKDFSIATPAVVFSLLLIVVVCISLLSTKWAVATIRFFDFLFFFLLGLSGLLLLFMWFGTDHKVSRNNYNLLWALPTHFIMAFFVHSKKQWTLNYFKIVFWLSILLAVVWFFLPQQMNNALLPILLLIIYRSRKLSKPD